MKEIKMFMFFFSSRRRHTRFLHTYVPGSCSCFYCSCSCLMIDEKLQPDEADKCDYFYVPCFFVGDEKVHEGTVDEEKVRAVFEKAAE